jgi:predicted nucleotidyltransferase
MNFEVVIRQVVGSLEAQGIRYALIGGFAMALRGIQRATMDLDFILMLEDMERADVMLTGCGYKRIFKSENVSHYTAEDGALGRIDILHAFRGPTLGMIKRADNISVFDDLSIKVVQVEDIVGLKIQAAVNDTLRARGDWADIHMMIRAAGETGAPLDWCLITEYLEIFTLESKLVELKETYAAAQ